MMRHKFCTTMQEPSSYDTENPRLNDLSENRSRSRILPRSLKGSVGLGVLIVVLLLAVWYTAPNRNQRMTSSLLGLREETGNRDELRTQEEDCENGDADDAEPSTYPGNNVKQNPEAFPQPGYPQRQENIRGAQRVNPQWQGYNGRNQGQGQVQGRASWRNGNGYPGQGQGYRQEGQYGNNPGPIYNNVPPVYGNGYPGYNNGYPGNNNGYPAFNNGFQNGQAIPQQILNQGYPQQFPQNYPAYAWQYNGNLPQQSNQQVTGQTTNTVTNGFQGINPDQQGPEKQLVQSQQEQNLQQQQPQQLEQVQQELKQQHQQFGTNMQPRQQQGLDLQIQKDLQQQQQPQEASTTLPTTTQEVSVTIQQQQQQQQLSQPQPQQQQQLPQQQQQHNHAKQPQIKDTQQDISSLQSKLNPSNSGKSAETATQGSETTGEPKNQTLQPATLKPTDIDTKQNNEQGEVAAVPGNQTPQSKNEDNQPVRIKPKEPLVKLRINPESVPVEVDDWRLPHPYRKPENPTLTTDTGGVGVDDVRKPKTKKAPASQWGSFHDHIKLENGDVLYNDAGDEDLPKALIMGCPETGVGKF